MNEQEPASERPRKGDVMEGFFISQFEKDLDRQGVDTVCFMGYGYSIEEVRVGSEFYFSYLYYGRMSDIRNGTKDDCLKAVLMLEQHNGNTNLFDRYKIMQKHKYYKCFKLDRDNRRTIPSKERRWYVKIKNLRTNEISIMHESTIDYSNLFCWVMC